MFLLNSAFTCIIPLKLILHDDNNNNDNYYYCDDNSELAMTGMTGNQSLD